MHGMDMHRTAWLWQQDLSLRHPSLRHCINRPAGFTGDHRKEGHLALCSSFEAQGLSIDV